MIKNVVLVHGGFVDGSGWQGVYKILAGEGFNVRIVQNPTLSLADDVAVTKRAIAAADGPVILVGHSVSTEDKMIPPPAQRQMAKRAESKVVETAASHSVYVSKPKVVADLISQAAREAK